MRPIAFEWSRFSHVFWHSCRALSRDADIYPDAEIFRPERFLMNGRLTLYRKDPSDFVFGFGRRYAAYLFIPSEPVGLLNNDCQNLSRAAFC